MDPQSLKDLLSNHNFNQAPSSTKPKKQLLTKEQEKTFKERLTRLQKQFASAINAKNLNDAKLVLSDLQQVLRSLNKINQLVEAKNKLFEMAMDQQELGLALSGFESNRKLVDPKTRLYLETTALLAIAHLRNRDIPQAKPYIQEVFQRRHNIKTEATKIKFNEEIINRFDEECVLALLRTEKSPDINFEDLEKEVERALQLSNDQLFAMLGKMAPAHVKQMLFEVDKFSKNLLTYQEQKLLASSEELSSDENTGKTIFSSLKRTIYKSLCSPDSEVYKMLFTNGLSTINGKKALLGVLASSIGGLGLVGVTITAFSAALIIRFGLDVYCEHYKPTEITSLRRKSK